MKSILVIQTYRYGDLLQSSPALAALRRRNPDARICVLTRKPFGEVLNGNPDVDEVVQWDMADINAALGAGPSVSNHQIEEVRALMGQLRDRQFDAVYNLANDLPSAVISHLVNPTHTAGLVLCHDRRYRVRNDWLRYLFVSTEARSLNGINLADIFAKACGGSRRQPPRLRITAQDQAYAKSILHGFNGEEPLIAIQAGASKEYKRWQEDRFADLAARLQGEGHPLLFLGSTVERPLVERIFDRLSPDAPRPLNVAGHTTFGQVAALLRRCRLLVSNDTAPIHVAAAGGTPSVVLTFGPTSARETAPYAEGHYVLEPLAPCFPCKWSAQCAGLHCRDMITPEIVVAVVRCALSDGRDVPHALRTGRPACRSLGAGRAALYRTEWMPDQLLGLRPLNRPPLTLRDLLRDILRAYYRGRLPDNGEEAIDKEWRPWLDEALSWYEISDREQLASKAAQAAKDFEALQKLAQLGARAAESLLLRDAQALHESTLSRLAGALERLEARVLASDANESLRFLVVGFRHAIRDMEPSGAAQAAEAHRLNYATLSHACGYVRTALNEFAHQGLSQRTDRPQLHMMSMEPAPSGAGG